LTKNVGYTLKNVDNTLKNADKKMFATFPKNVDGKYIYKNSKIINKK
jgi:hypothetical protein